MLFKSGSEVKDVGVNNVYIFETEQCVFEGLDLILLTTQIVSRTMKVHVYMQNLLIISM